MLVEKEVQKILRRLAIEDSINVPFDGSDITVRVIDRANQLSLTALVYDGGNYIPKSVRLCISHQSPFFHPSIITFLTIDENHYQVKLNYLSQSQIKSLNKEDLKEILEEFGIIAENWRHYLDEHDKDDLVYVKVK